MPSIMLRCGRDLPKMTAKSMHNRLENVIKENEMTEESYTSGVTHLFFLIVELEPNLMTRQNHPR